MKSPKQKLKFLFTHIFLCCYGYNIYYRRKLSVWFLLSVCILFVIRKKHRDNTEVRVFSFFFMAVHRNMFYFLLGSSQIKMICACEIFSFIIYNRIIGQLLVCVCVWVVHLLYHQFTCVRIYIYILYVGPALFGIVIIY